jgi:ClpP class serine protease
MTQPHSLFRYTSKIFNTPQFIVAEEFTPILQYLSSRNLGDIEFSSVVKAAAAPKKPEMVNKIGELNVSGALTYKPVMALCEATGTSYTGLLQDFESLIAEGVKTVVMVHNSGGGEASHMMTTADRLRELADQNGVKLISYIDTISASASLGLGIVADEVIIHPEARTGSVGALIALVDRSKALADAGIKPIYISSVEGKVPFKADGSFSDKFIAKMQKEVTDLGTKFAEHVSKYSGIPVQDIINLDAEVFNAEEALKIGFVNKIMNHQQFAEYLATLKD